MESKTYIFDTGIILGYARDAPYSRHIDSEYNPIHGDNITVVSVVSRGEIFSLAYQFGWGQQKRETLQHHLDQITTVDVNQHQIVDRYAEIDAYSQNAHPTRELGDSDRNMGKNDVWIAATASVLEGTLITTDTDFDHLQGEFLDRVYVDPNAEYDL